MNRPYPTEPAINFAQMAGTSTQMEGRIKRKKLVSESPATAIKPMFVKSSITTTPTYVRNNLLAKDLNDDASAGEVSYAAIANRIHRLGDGQNQNKHPTFKNPPRQIRTSDHS